MLKPLAKVWYRFLRHKLSPTAHLETVEKEMPVFLHRILKNKKINAGEMIKEEIATCAMKKKGTLIFLCLITDLCIQQGIEYTPGEGMVKNSGAIGMNCILRLFSNSDKVAEASASKLQRESNLVQQDHSMVLEQKLDQLTDMLQQQIQREKQFLEFSFPKYQWEKQTMKLNNMKMKTPIPIFPREILPLVEEK